MPKYAFKQAKFELEFNKIENEWVSIQTILDQVFCCLDPKFELNRGVNKHCFQDPAIGKLSNLKTALQRCWISNQVSTNTNGQDFFDLLTNGNVSKASFMTNS